jgi:acetylornithine deacetylase/succinyl-diaminopimelate desuccinylase-like protein
MDLTFDSVEQLFIALARIDSPSLAEAELFAFVASLLASAGFPVRYDRYGNMVASSPDAYEAATPPVLLTCHGDIESNGRPIDPQIIDGRIVATGGNVLGADNKAALACALWVMLGKPHRPVELVVTRNEENGFVGARSFDTSLVRSQAGLNLDGTDASTIMVSSLYWYDLHCPDTTTSDQLAAIAASLEETGEVRRTKVGTGDERTRIFVFADSAEADIAIHDVVTGHVAGPYRLVLSTPGYTVSDDDPLVLALSSAIARAGLTPIISSEIVGTEGCIFNSRGISMVTTGVTYGGEHTVEESVTVDALRQSVRIIDAFLDNYPDNVDAARRRQGMR